MQQDKQLPPNAKLAFKGKIFEVWQWEQKMFDGSTAIFERLKRPNTAIVIPVVGENILIQNQQQPHRKKIFPSLPGGRCEREENPLKAAKRELLEETGYAANDWILFKEIHPMNKIIWTVYAYIAKNCSYKEAPCLDAGEKITTRLISFDEFLLLSENPDFYEKELVGTLLRARFDPKFRKKFHNLLFKI